MLISTRAIHKNDFVYASACERNVKVAEIKMQTLGTTLTQKCPHAWEVMWEWFFHLIVCEIIVTSGAATQRLLPSVHT